MSDSLSIVCSPLDCGRLAEHLETLQVRGFETVQPRKVSDRELTHFHTEQYVRDLRAGWSDEWVGDDKELANKHISAAGATLRMAERIWRGKIRRGFAPHGLRSLAHPSMSVWGHVVNDAALAAGWLARRRLRVSLVDIGRVRPALNVPGVQDIFPVNADVFTDAELDAYVEVAADMVRDYSPDVILYAASPIHMDDDPTTFSTCTLNGYMRAASRVARLADEVCSGRVLAGGGLGFSMDGWTEAAWAATCRGLAVSNAESRAVSPPDPNPEPAPARSGLRLIQGGIS